MKVKIMNDETKITTKKGETFIVINGSFLIKESIRVVTFTTMFDENITIPFENIDVITYKPYKSVGIGQCGIK
jgi:hypothetical protein